MEQNDYKITRDEKIKQLYASGICVEIIAERLAIETNIVRVVLGLGIKMRKNYVLYVKKCDRLDPI